MVVSLPYFARGRNSQHGSSRMCLQVQDSRGCVYVPVAMLNLILNRDSECLAQIGQATEEKETVGGSKYREMFKLKALHILALFTLVYVGVEVTIGGESISLLYCIYADTVRR